MTDSNDPLAIGERFVEALEAGDLDAVRTLYSKDAKVWQNFDPRDQTVDDNLKVLQWLRSKLDNMHFEIVRREPIPDGFYQQHVVRGNLANGEAFAMPACLVVKVSDGHIVSLDEYLDTAHVAPLRKAK